MALRSFLLLAVVGFFQEIQGHSICYPVYGCFSDDAPFHRATGPLPQSPAKIDTKFLLFTRDDPRAGEMLEDLKNETIRISSFNPSRKTVVLSHGYVERVTQFWIQPFVRALLTAEDVNVIVVGWGNGAQFPYHFASSNIRVVGAQLTHLLDMIRAIKGLDVSRLHLIAFSLGAHMMSYVGRNYRRKGLIINRITGLDPASPYFEFEHPDVRLDPTDAKFVDVIHSNSRLNGIFSLGCEQPLGHADFYPNGGKYQPGCPDLRPEAVLDLANIVACSHYRAVLLYIESINNTMEFESYPCKTWEDFKLGRCTKCPNDACPRMGHSAQETSNNATFGTSYLETFGTEKFNGVHYRVTFYTGTGLFADLDAGIEITLGGKKLQSKAIQLEKRYLPHGSTATFIVTTHEDLGELTDISFKINSLLEMWYLEKMEVAKLPLDETYGACYQTYINSFSRKVKLYRNNNAC